MNQGQLNDFLDLSGPGGGARPSTRPSGISTGAALAGGALAGERLRSF